MCSIFFERSRLKYFSSFAALYFCQFLLQRKMKSTLVGWKKRFLFEMAFCFLNGNWQLFFKNRSIFCEVAYVLMKEFDVIFHDSIVYRPDIILKLKIRFWVFKYHLFYFFIFSEFCHKNWKKTITTRRCGCHVHCFQIRRDVCSRNR